MFCHSSKIHYLRDCFYSQYVAVYTYSIFFKVCICHHSFMFGNDSLIIFLTLHKSYSVEEDSATTSDLKKQENGEIVFSTKRTSIYPLEVQHTF